jgi:hypothetical protein
VELIAFTDVSIFLINVLGKLLTYMDSECRAYLIHWNQKDRLVLSPNPIPLINSESSSTNKECYCELAGTWCLFLNLYAFHYHTWRLQWASDKFYDDYAFVVKE